MAVQPSVPHVVRACERDTSIDDLVGFRAEFYDSLTLRAGALFELTDAVLCSDGPVTTLVELCLAGVHRRGHGAGSYTSRRHHSAGTTNQDAHPRHGTAFKLADPATWPDTAVVTINMTP